jgi:hypothetical protein
VKVDYSVILPGDRFGRWTITGRKVTKPVSKGTRPYFPCICDCGRPVLVRASSLVNGGSSRCKGCIGRENPRKDNTGRKKLQWFAEEKDNPCVDCGKSYPFYIMQFDHVPERGPKLFSINKQTINSRLSVDDFKNERTKCDLVCSNCHDNRTWWRSQGKPIQLLKGDEDVGDSV